MFFNAHVYYGQRVDKNLNPLKVAGCMFSDFAKTGLITWDDLHKRQGILEFSNYVKKSAPEFDSFAKGIIYHNNLDYTSHVEYKNSTPGYSYAIITPELMSLVQKALNLDAATTKSMAHNFIEASVDYHLLKETLEPVKLIKSSAEEIDMLRLAKILSVYFKKNEEEILLGVKDFFAFVTRFDLRSIDEWVKLFVDLGTNFLETEVNEEYIKKALELSFNLTNNTYREYLETSIASWNNEIKDST